MCASYMHGTNNTGAVYIVDQSVQLYYDLARKEI